MIFAILILNFMEMKISGKGLLVHPEKNEGRSPFEVVEIKTLKGEVK